MIECSLKCVAAIVLVTVATTFAIENDHTNTNEGACKNDDENTCRIQDLWSSATPIQYQPWNPDVNILSSIPYITRNQSITWNVINAYSNLNDLANDLGVWKMKTYMSTSKLLIKNYNTIMKKWSLLKILQKSNQQDSHYKFSSRTHAYIPPKLMEPLLELPTDVFPKHETIPPILRINVQSDVKWSSHYDSLNNRILQVLGSKAWLVFPLSMKDDICDVLNILKDGSPSERHSRIDLAHPSKQNRKMVEKLIKEYGIKVILHPGDILYVPAGFIHFTISVTKECMSINWFHKST
jgi:hypothetical protein